MIPSILKLVRIVRRVVAFAGLLVLGSPFLAYVAVVGILRQIAMVEVSRILCAYCPTITLTWHIL